MRKISTLALLALLPGCAVVSRGQAVSAGCGDRSTQSEMNLCFAESAGDAEARLQVALNRLLTAAHDEQRRASVQRTQEAWLRYREEQCRHEASLYEGGSLQPTIYASCMSTLTDDRVQELQAMLEEEQR